MKGTVTDFDGKYEMKVNEGDQVVFRYVGYEDQKLAATGSQTFDLIMGEQETELNTVVISASRSKEKILDAPASIVSVEAAAIKNKAGVGITDHLKNVSGVQVQRTGVQGGQPSVRGFSGYFTSDVMSLTDNRVAKLPNTGLNMYQMMTTTDEDIERIEVLKGPAGNAPHFGGGFKYRFHHFFVLCQLCAFTWNGLQIRDFHKISTRGDTLGHAVKSRSHQISGFSGVVSNGQVFFAHAFGDVVPGHFTSLFQFFAALEAGNGHVVVFGAGAAGIEALVQNAKRMVF